MADKDLDANESPFRVPSPNLFFRFTGLMYSSVIIFTFDNLGDLLCSRLLFRGSRRSVLLSSLSSGHKYTLYIFKQFPLLVFPSFDDVLFVN